MIYFVWRAVVLIHQRLTDLMLFAQRILNEYHHMRNIQDDHRMLYANR